MKYPRIEKFGIPIRTDLPGPPGIWIEDISLILGKEGHERFSAIFGEGQTCGENGLYPWDVEAVLERMESGKLTGSQLHWD